jgi:hypothetical protein
VLEEVAAGYLILRRVPRPPYASPDLLPAFVVSVSECICPRFPDTSAIDWVQASEEARSDALRAVGVASQSRAEARAWATDQFGTSFGWPGVFYSVAAALEARDRFVPAGMDVVVVGVALPSSWLEAFIAIATPPPAAEGFAPQGESAYLETARRREPLSAGHRRLGFELLNADAGQVGCSWLCNGLEAHCANTLNIAPNANGLLETLSLAERCRSEISREEVGAEPGPWFPWLLVEYA